MCVGRLLVNGNRVVDAAGDARGPQLLLQSVPVSGADDVQVVDVAAAGALDGLDDRVGQVGGVDLRQSPPMLVPGCRRSNLTSLCSIL